MADYTPSWSDVVLALMRNGAIRCSSDAIEGELLKLAGTMDSVIAAAKDGRLDLSCIEEVRDSASMPAGE